MNLLNLRLEWTLIRYELLLLSRAPAFRPLCAFLVIALSLSAWNGDNWVRTLDTTRQHMLQEQEQRWQTHVEDARRFEEGTLDPGFSDPLNAYTLYGWTPWSSQMESRRLAYLAVGQSDLHLSYRITSPAQPNPLGHHSEIQNPSTLVLGRFDVARCVTLVLPLLLMVLVLPTTEETNGPLGHLIDVQSGAMPRAFLRRTIVRWASFCALTGGLIVALTAIFSPRAFMEEPANLVFAVVASAAYLSTWAALALGSSLLGWSGTRSAMASALVWFAACLIAPAAVDGVATSRAPHPDALLELLEERAQDLRLADRTDLASELAAELDAADPLPSSTNIASRVEHMRRLRNSREDALATLRDARDSAARGLATLLPPLLTQRLLHQASGTDTQSFLAYEAFHRGVGESRVRITLPALFRGEDSGLLERRAVETFVSPSTLGDEALPSTSLSTFCLLVPGLLVAFWSVRKRS